MTLAVLAACVGVPAYVATVSVIGRVIGAMAENYSVPAPPFGSDRAGGPYNGHPAHERQPRGAASRDDFDPGKDGNGALHDLAGAA